MSVTRDDVEKVAALAALSIDPATVDRLTGQLGSILDYVDRLAAVESDGAVAYRPGPAHIRLREDAVEPARTVDITTVSRHTHDHLVTVPRVGTVGREAE